MTPNDSIKVRAADRADLDAIVVFNVALAAETESKTLDPIVLARGVLAALGDPDRLRYWVAETPAGVVGQAAVTREWSDWRAGWVWWFQSVYVHADARRTGVFRALYRQVREEARAAGDVVGLRLYVEHANDRAKRTYQSLGMNPGGYDVFEEIWPERFGRP